MCLLQFSKIYLSRRNFCFKMFVIEKTQSKCWWINYKISYYFWCSSSIFFKTYCKIKYLRLKWTFIYLVFKWLYSVNVLFIEITRTSVLRHATSVRTCLAVNIYLRDRILETFNAHWPGTRTYISRRYSAIRNERSSGPFIRVGEPRRIDKRRTIIGLEYFMGPTMGRKRSFVPRGKPWAHPYIYSMLTQRIHIFGAQDYAFTMTRIEAPVTLLTHATRRTPNKTVPRIHYKTMAKKKLKKENRKKNISTKEWKQLNGSVQLSEKDHWRFSTLPFCFFFFIPRVRDFTKRILAWRVNWASCWGIPAVRIKRVSLELVRECAMYMVNAL